MCVHPKPSQMDGAVAINNYAQMFMYYKNVSDICYSIDLNSR